MATSKRLTRRNILLALLALLIIMQFFPIDKTNPPVESGKDFLQQTNAPLMAQRLFKDACYDCHSNEVKYPWYTNIAPLSFWIAGHIRNGKRQVNFSTWADYPSSKQKHKIEECIEVLEEKRMPLTSYTLLHPEAKMSAKEQTELINWLKNL